LQDLVTITKYNFILHEVFTHKHIEGSMDKTIKSTYWHQA